MLRVHKVTHANTTLTSQILVSVKHALPKRCLLFINPLKAELNPICHLLALLGAHHILHVSRIRVKNVNLPT
jgi:transposase